MNVLGNGGWGRGDKLRNVAGAGEDGEAVGEGGQLVEGPLGEKSDCWGRGNLGNKREAGGGTRWRTETERANWGTAKQSFVQVSIHGKPCGILPSAQASCHAC